MKNGMKMVMNKPKNNRKPTKNYEEPPLKDFTNP